MNDHISSFHPANRTMSAIMGTAIALAVGSAPPVSAQTAAENGAEAPAVKGLFDSFFQVGYVTTDIEKALEYYRTKFGAENFWIFDTSIARPDDPFPNKIALGWIGDTMVELIEPSAGKDDPLYGDAMPDDGTAFHHTGYLVHDEVRWKEVLAMLEAAGIPTIRGGQVGDTLEFVYADARAQVGHYLEFVWLKNVEQNLLTQVPHN